MRLIIYNVVGDTFQTYARTFNRITVCNNLKSFRISSEKIRARNNNEAI
jgi:hypothetical protein